MQRRNLSSVGILIFSFIHKLIKRKIYIYGVFDYLIFLQFRLLEEVSELEDSMRQLELKNEQSEASLRDMQVIIVF